MKSKDQILLENAYARTYGIRNVKDSEVEQMIEDLNKIQSQVSVMHHGQLTNLKQHLESVVGKIDGRLTSSKATKEVADKHGVSIEQIEAQVEKGIKVEMEHTSNEESAKKIALDHLAEVPDYYDKLKQVEGK